jgi:hypothetical protein
MRGDVNHFERERIKSAINRSLNRLAKNDGMLFDAPIERYAGYDARKLHEVCINHKLAEYLKEEIAPLNETDESLFVDIEFNREGVDFKDVKIGEHIERVRPDIIVHNRHSGPQRFNLLIAECKKSGCRRYEIAHDRQKIIGLMSDSRYTYKFGLQVIYSSVRITASFFFKEGGNINILKLKL